MSFCCTFVEKTALKLLIIDNYDSFTFNLVQLVEQCNFSNFEVVKNDRLFDLDISIFDKVLISPGPGIAEEAGDLMEFLRKNYRQKSILGICLGYEALGEMFGSCLTKLPQPMHGIQNRGRIIVNNKIFKNLPSVFKIGHYHSWIIEEASLPPALEIILKDENETPMAFAHKSLDITGLMFHPESIMTEHGKEMIANWLEN
jgi:anthranilate synthase component 2